MTADTAGRLPDLLYDDTERSLADALKTLLDSQAGLLARTESAETYDTALWRKVAADLGCAGLLIPERDGGAGASYREAASAAEELGAAVAPVPFVGSAVVATVALLACARSGSAEAERLLRRMADGELTVALAIGFATAPDAPFPRSVRVAGPHQGDKASGWARLRGSVRGVADALPAAMLLVPSDGVPHGLYAVDLSSARVTRSGVVSLDMTRQLCDISFDDAPATPIVSGSAAADAVNAALRAGACVLAAELLGVAQRCLDMTVAYVKERHQFARPVGSFQAVKVRLADLWVSVAQARAAARYAAACLATGAADAPVAVALAKAYCSDVAVQAAQECVQLHGGIGFTWEHPAHLYLKRAKADSLAFGTADAHRRSLASLVNLPAP
ncbi:MAG TPA: acyl-CoA dehydrogenase family protein [Streptosporangiaceae bacterium]|nr:acyl-CoA dehydrogenase family protein [Streptosporangiaceae bacterium]